MAARAIAALSLTFGLVSIPVKVYSATESSSAVRFKLMGRGGARLRQQYVADDVDGASGWVGETRAAADSDEVAVPVRASKGREEATASTVSRLAAVASPPARSAAPAPEPVAADRTVGSSVVEREDIVKGYEIEKGRFVLFTPA